MKSKIQAQPLKRNTSYCGLKAQTLNKIKTQVLDYTKTYEALHARYFEIINSLLLTTCKNETREQLAHDLFLETETFYNAVNQYGLQFDLDNHFVNDFILLKLKVNVLLARTRNSTATTLAEHNFARLLYGQAIYTLNDHVNSLQFTKDTLFQTEMDHCFFEIMNNKLQVNLNGQSLLQMIYDFSQKCTDPVLKMGQQYQAVKTMILHNKNLNQLAKAAKYREFVGLYDEALSQHNDLKKNNKETNSSKLKLIFAILVQLKFIENCHPTLRKTDPTLAFTQSNKEQHKKSMKIYTDLKKSHFDTLSTLFMEIELTTLTISDLFELRKHGQELVAITKNFVSLLLSWNKLLNGQNDKAELLTSRQTIIELYKECLQLASFYNEFFKRYPEENYYNMTPMMSLFLPENNYKDQIKSDSELNQLIKEFEQEEVIRDALFLKEKQDQLKISAESAQFLIDLQKKENAFRQERREKRALKKASVNTNIPESQNDYEETKTKPSPQEPKDLPYFTQAAREISAHNYGKAILLYEIVYEKAKIDKDLLIQLRALDGLSITYGNILVKDMAYLLTLLQTRLNCKTPLSRDKRIDLETSFYNLIAKLAHFKALHLDLTQLAQNKSLSLDEDSRAGIKFGQLLFTDLIQFLSAKSKEIQTQYHSLLQKIASEKNEFIQKLGREEAKRLNLSNPDILTLGKNKFAEIGQKKVTFSDNSYEQLLLNELKSDLHQLNITLGQFKPLNKTNTIHCTNALTESSQTITVSTELQNIFSFLDSIKGDHYLFGSAALDCLLAFNNQHSINPQDLDFLSTATAPDLITAHFNSCKYIPDLYYYKYNHRRIELTSTKEEPLTRLSKQIFTISTLSIQKQNSTFVVNDSTGRGLRDLELMRLVMLEDPNLVFTKDPTAILFCLKYCLKGFHPDLAIVNALKQLKALESFDRSHFDAIAKKQLSLLDFEGRKAYTNLFLHYGLLTKLFALDCECECDLMTSLTQLERYLDTSSLCVSANQNGVFAKSEIATQKQTTHHQDRVMSK